MLKLGCIADDFGVATALGQQWVKAGFQVVQTFGLPRSPLTLPCDAVVVTLRTRYSRPGDAVVRALDALMWLRNQGVEQVYFCFSPTFDSVFEGKLKGNIGPVIEALMDTLRLDFTAVVPAAPGLDIAVFRGHLFVGQVPLSETELAEHPRTPMKDANLLRVLQAQTKRQVMLIEDVYVRQGTVAVQERMVEVRLAGYPIALVDASTQADLLAIATAAKHMRLAAGGPDWGGTLAQNYHAPWTADEAEQVPPVGGKSAVLCGSGNAATMRQIQHFHAAGLPAMALDPMKIAKFSAEKVAQAALAWAQPLLEKGPVLLYSTADEATRAAVKALLGVANAGALVEDCLGHIAEGMLRLGVRRLAIGGTDTGAYCMRRLGFIQSQIGPEVEPGIPWRYAQWHDPQDEAQPIHVHVLVKPGGVGTDTVFIDAFNTVGILLP